MNTRLAGLILALSLMMAGCQSTSQQVVDEGANTPPPKPVMQAKPIEKAPVVVSQPAPVQVDPNSYEELLKIRTIYFEFDRSGQ